MTAATDGLEPLLHPPLRLQIAAILAQVSDMEFATLRDLTKVSDSVLSKHLSALIDGGLVEVRKAARDGRQRTWAALTRPGRKVYDRHLAALHALVAASAKAATRIGDAQQA
ncbi:transcriptional regulator [Sphingomonas donggukensis]|uniref:Transcriptional regulator n=1 Tax=Sphingomonas donggukensis TaxID=2949093 RepID=A0ABY4TSQ7_9SPHN|nr:transcriptional regulator [Sphingomonas donggukensis]URW75434.1 transcriptional regulator [Sphingomonas donggukensis]